MEHDTKDGQLNNQKTENPSSNSTDSLSMTDEGVSECFQDTFASDFDEGSIGPGRISAMSVEDDGASFILSQSFAGSTVTELSSVFSMSEDDFDKMASRHARLLFDDIDSMLFEHQNDGPPHLIKECLEWQAKFPHLRVLGHRVIDREEEGFHLYPTLSLASTGMDNRCTIAESKDLLVHGKQCDVMQLGDSLSTVDLTPSNGGSSLVSVEEVLEENGTMEEILAIDYKTGDDECQKLNQSKQFSGRPPVTPFSCVKDNIMSAVFNQVLMQILPTMKPVLEKFLETAAERRMSDPQLNREPADNLERLINSSYSEKSSKSSGFANSMLSAVPENMPLGGLLTIRSKTLINRERTLGIPDGITDNLQSQTVPSIRLNPVMFGSHLPERRSSLNRIKLSPLENNRLQSSLAPAMQDVDQATNSNLAGLRGHRLATLTSQASVSPTPKLPPLQSQRTIMSANVPNTNINRSMQANKRNSQRAISAVPEKDVKVSYREKDRSSLALDLRPNTTQTIYNNDKKNETLQSISSRQPASLLPLGVTLRPATALSAKMMSTPSLVLSGSGIMSRKTEKLEPGGNEASQAGAGHLDLARRASGPFDDIMQVANRWNPINLNRGKIFKNLQGGVTAPSVHSRLLQLRQSHHKTTVS